MHRIRLRWIPVLVAAVGLAPSVRPLRAQVAADSVPAAPIAPTVATAAPSERRHARAHSVPATLDELRLRLQAILDSTRTRAAGVALVTRDSVIWAGGVGLARVADSVRADERTLFRIGSTSKSFVSLVMLQLQDEGKLRLEDPLRQHIPDIAFENRWEATDPVRIVNALEHTTGFDDWALRDYAHSDPTPTTLRAGLEHTPSTRVSRWRPGTRVAYNNSGPPLAAYIAERLEGKPFEQIVQERIFDPLAMRTATWLLPDTTQLTLATLYQGDGVTPHAYWHVIMRPAGSINASAEEMGRYVRMLLNRGTLDGARVATPEAIGRLERSTASLTARAGLPVGYGLHMARYVDSNFVWVGHDGGVNGGLTNLAYIPELGVGYVFMINSGNGEAFQRISRLLRDYLTRDAELPLPLPAAAMPAEVNRYAGWYRPDNPRMQRLVFVTRLLGLTRADVRDSVLVLDPLLGRPFRYVPVEGATFREEREPVATLALLHDAPNDRPVAIEQMGYLLPTSLVRTSTAAVMIEIAIASLWAAALVLTVLVALFGLGRRVFRRGRPASVAAPTWRRAFAATMTLVLAIGAVAWAMAGSEFGIGEMNAGSVSFWILLLAFPVVALAALIAAIRARPAGSRGARLSLWTARVVAVLHVVVAAYLTYWGIVGWRPWS